jgi:hypothetical protein
LNDTAPPNN